MSSCLMMSLGIVASFAISNLALGGMPPGPCKEVRAACISQGFYRGGANKGKGLKENCMEVLKNKGAGSVPGVTVTQDKIDACKARAASMKGAAAASSSGAGAPADQE